MTNFDTIPGMTLEQLAKLIGSTGCPPDSGTVSCMGYVDPITHAKYCDRCWEHWLKKEAAT